jgi:hypothetical protein
MANGTRACSDFCLAEHGAAEWEYVDNSCAMSSGGGSCKEPKRKDFSSCCACGSFTSEFSGAEIYNGCYDEFKPGIGTEAYISGVARAGVAGVAAGFAAAVVGLLL